MDMKRFDKVPIMEIIIKLAPLEIYHYSISLYSCTDYFQYNIKLQRCKRALFENNEEFWGDSSKAQGFCQAHHSISNKSFWYTIPEYILHNEIG